MQLFICIKELGPGLLKTFMKLCWHKCWNGEGSKFSDKSQFRSNFKGYNLKRDSERIYLLN